LKLNLAELELITGWFAPYRDAFDRVRVLQDRFNIPNVVVTRGGDGALFNKDGVFYEHPGITVQLADTIGAGDAFLAGLLSGLAKGVSPPDALAFASAMGAFVASRAGPCPDYRPAEVFQLINTNS
jgi:fructokinase